MAGLPPGPSRLPGTGGTGSPVAHQFHSAWPGNGIWAFLPYLSSSSSQSQWPASQLASMGFLHGHGHYTSSHWLRRVRMSSYLWLRLALPLAGHQAGPLPQALPSLPCSLACHHCSLGWPRNGRHWVRVVGPTGGGHLPEWGNGPCVGNLAGLFHFHFHSLFIWSQALAQLCRAISHWWLAHLWPRPLWLRWPLPTWVALAPLVITPPGGGPCGLLRLLSLPIKLTLQHLYGLSFSSFYQYLPPLPPGSNLKWHTLSSGGLPVVRIGGPQNHPIQNGSL